jgi:hypothetical protein
MHVILACNRVIVAKERHQSADVHPLGRLQTLELNWCVASTEDPREPRRGRSSRFFLSVCQFQQTEETAHGCLFLPEHCTPLR